MRSEQKVLGLLMLWMNGMWQGHAEASRNSHEPVCCMMSLPTHVRCAFVTTCTCGFVILLCTRLWKCFGKLTAIGIRAFQGSLLPIANGKCACCHKNACKTGFGVDSAIYLIDSLCGAVMGKWWTVGWCDRAESLIPLQRWLFTNNGCLEVEAVFIPLIPQEFNNFLFLSM